jgi:hypothetical protein
MTSGSAAHLKTKTSHTKELQKIIELLIACILHPCSPEAAHIMPGSYEMIFCDKRTKQTGITADEVIAHNFELCNLYLEAQECLLATADVSLED